jgi:DNA-binding PadR family transcriptional regulator
MHGYQLIQEISRRSGGGWRPSPGSVYPTLQQLEDEGLVHAEEREGKRVYSLTGDGRAFADEHADEFATLWDGYQPNDDDAELGDLVFGVAGAFVHVMKTGSDRQIAAARRVLARTRADLYRILADDAGGPAASSATSATSTAGPEVDEGDNGETGRSDTDPAESGEGDHDGDGSGGRP